MRFSRSSCGCWNKTSLERLCKGPAGWALLSEALRLHGLGWVTERAPSFEAAFERPDLLEPGIPQLKRHTGAGGFVGSSAVEDHFLIARNLVCPAAQFVGTHQYRPRHLEAIALHFKRMSKINHGESRS